jgi:hypothetical protein
MRKIFITLAALGVLSANAQNKTTAVKSFNVDAIKKDAAAEVKNYKPIKGTITTEVGLTGGLNDANFSLNNNAGLLRFRYFLKNDIAVRIGFSAVNRSNTKNFYGPANTPIAGLLGFVETKNSGITVNLGAEKHFKGSDRLSTYLGVDLLIRSNSATEKRDNANAAGTAFQQASSGNIKGQNANGTSGSGFGFRLVTGAEYYIVKNVYLGVEVGFGFESIKSKAISGQSTSATIVNFVATNPVTIPIDIKSPGKNSSISPSVITGIRIGFQF